jgi:hypothetical protein
MPGRDSNLHAPKGTPDFKKPLDRFGRPRASWEIAGFGTFGGLPLGGFRPVQLPAVAPSMIPLRAPDCSPVLLLETPPQT